MAFGEWIAGTWLVTYGKYKYLYTISGTSSTAGAVRWRDYWDKDETGKGTWKKSGEKVVFTWEESGTRETWSIEDDKVTSASGSVIASYGTFSLSASKQDIIDDANEDLIRRWAKALDRGEPFASTNNPSLCIHATPYWAIPGIVKKPLAAQHVGGPTRKIRGLCVHTTAGNGSRKEFQTVDGTVQEWNKVTAYKVSAHFAIAATGKLIQIVPATRIAFAQGDASPDYISVEIETADMQPMNGPQLRTARLLYKWVNETFGVPPGLALGYVGEIIHSKDEKVEKGRVWTRGKFDPLTRSICGDRVTSTLREAATSIGLTCHYWVSPTKPCPGEGIIRQLPEIVSG